MLTWWKRSLWRRVGDLETWKENAVAQIDDLDTALNRIKTDVDAKVGDLTGKVSALTQELTDLQNSTPATVDLTGAIAKANGIADGLEGISSAVTATPQS